MIDSQLAIAKLKNTLKTTLSTLLILGIGLWSKDALAQIPTLRNTVQSLDGIEARGEKCPGSINLKSANSGSESMVNLPLQRAREASLSTYSDFEKLTDHPRSDWEVKSASQDWLNLNQGDGSQGLIRFVVYRF